LQVVGSLILQTELLTAVVSILDYWYLDSHATGNSILTGITCDLPCHSNSLGNPHQSIFLHFILWSDKTTRLLKSHHVQHSLV